MRLPEHDLWPRIILFARALPHEQGNRAEAGRQGYSHLQEAGDCFQSSVFFRISGEKPADARKTTEFIAEEIHGAATFSFGTFEVQRGSAVEKDPAAFGLRHVDHACGPLAVKYAYSRSRAMRRR